MFELILYLKFKVSNKLNHHDLLINQTKPIKLRLKPDAHRKSIVSCKVSHRKFNSWYKIIDWWLSFWPQFICLFTLENILKRSIYFYILKVFQIIVDFNSIRGVKMTQLSSTMDYRTVSTAIHIGGLLSD